MALWAVTCADLHFCIGPIPSKSLATRLAMLMTEREGNEGCVYVPVQMNFLMMVDDPSQLPGFSESKSEKRKGDDSWVKKGQYL